jgi:hypothetical protein
LIRRILGRLENCLIERSFKDAVFQRESLL